jgi:hypothetical protein
MTHVERIVRPVVGGERLKLRMRQELLAHLEAAVREEQAAGADEAAAIQRALSRLGEPWELTRQLQQTVPRLHTLLLTDCQLISLMERHNASRDASPVAGLGALDFGPVSHAVTLLGMPSVLSILLSVAMLLRLMQQIPAGMSGLPDARALILIALLPLCAAAIGSMLFSLAMAGLATDHRWMRALVSAALAVGAPQVMVCFLAAATRNPHLARECAHALGLSIPLLLSLAVIARWIAALRRPYEQWLTLEV